jgi:hypothetical protein
MTGSGSRGNGGIYHYYHCQRKYGCHNSFKAADANEDFVRYLKSFEISSDIIELYNYILEDVFANNEVEKETERRKLEHSIRHVEMQIESLENKFIEDTISAEQYNHLLQKLENRKNEFVMQHVTITKTKRDFSQYISYSFSMLSNLSEYYSKANTAVKRKIISSIFPEKVIYEQKQYRTTKLNEVISLLCRPVKGFKKRQPTSSGRLSSWAPQTGLEPVTL